VKKKTEEEGNHEVEELRGQRRKKKEIESEQKENPVKIDRVSGGNHLGCKKRREREVWIIMERKKTNQKKKVQKYTKRPYANGR
jgi:hypothetical protein